uniref:hypothetical protein n=1 Tax=Streptosporangium sp. CA-235898 TaxID=3240073 RepID=UPI003F4941E3
MTDRDLEERERGIWERVAEIERTLADRRAGAAEQALRKVAELAAQHLADTKPHRGRSPILGALAGGPAVAHFAELVLAITGPPPARTVEERVESAPSTPPEQTINEWYWASRLHGNTPLVDEAPIEERTAELKRWQSAAEAPEHGTEEYRWWAAGARYEHNLRTEGLGMDVLEALKTAENLARLYPGATAADLAEDLAAAYPQPPAAAPPKAVPSTSPGAWLAALDILRQREQAVWNFLTRRCVGIAAEKAEDDRPRLVVTFDGHFYVDRFFHLTHEGRRYVDILVEALNKVTGEDWWVAADPGIPEPAVPLVDAATVEERVRNQVADRIHGQMLTCSAPKAPGEEKCSECFTCGGNAALLRVEWIARFGHLTPGGDEAPLNKVTKEQVLAAFDIPESVMVDSLSRADIEEQVRADIAARLRAEGQDCDNHPWPGWGASCWTCGRIGMLARAEAIALGRWNPPAGKEGLDLVPEYGTDAYRWWWAGILRAQQLRAQTIGDDALTVLDEAEDLARRRPDMTGADLVDELTRFYPQPDPEPAPTPTEPLAPLADSLERRPHVVAAPWLFFGRPALARTGTDTLAAIGPYLAGDTPETVLAELDITRGEFLTACWWEAHWGTRTKEWAAWREQHAGALGEGHWRGYDDIPYPPRPDADGQHTGGEPDPDPEGSLTASRPVAQHLLTQAQILDTFDYPEAVMTAALTHATQERAELAALTAETIREAMAKLRAAPMYPPYRLDGRWGPKETVPPVPGLPVRETKENPAPDPEEPDELDEPDTGPEPVEDQAAGPCAYLDEAARPVVGVDLGADGESALTASQGAHSNRVTLIFNEAF